MVLSALQQHLESLYEVDVEHRVMDFLITDARLASALAQQHDGRPGPECLLVRQTDDAVDVSLYIDQAVLSRLDANNPFVALHSHNINDFLIALEGVSHFLYLAWNAGYEKPITPMELELQAEIDKYVTTAALMHAQHDGDSPVDLHTMLFDKPMFDDDLDESALERYRHANHFAALYCQQLEQHFEPQKRDQNFINELRRFYRLPRNDKLRRILDR